MLESKRANSYQVGGDHYNSDYQHWDLAITIPYSYLEAASTKYVVRAKKKHGVEDLRKSLHYLNKLDECKFQQPRKLNYLEVVEEVRRFVEANALGSIERAFLELLATWKTSEDLEQARQFLFALLDEAQGLAPVPLTEENHYTERAPKDILGW